MILAADTLFTGLSGLIIFVFIVWLVMRTLQRG
jgi:hypothetical protein